jgi:hypothetical protein
MLEYALDLETKIRAASLSGRDNAFAIVALCGAGFQWHESELEDLLSF